MRDYRPDEGTWGESMSVQKPRDRNSTNAAHARTAQKLASFAQSKKVLLQVLRDMYSRGPNTRPFNVDKARDSLMRIANEYL
jgi:hypothetical protein